MAKFIEYKYKSKPWWTTLFMYCWSGMIVVLAVILFMQGVASTIGFVLILACGYGGLILLNEQVERHSRIVTEVASGKLPKLPSKTEDHTFLEFREDPFGRGALVFVSCITVLIFTTSQKTKRAGSAVGLVLVTVASALLFLCLAVLWLSLVRLRIEGDEVQVTYPFLRGWGNRGFHFGEIASVKVREGRRGSKEVRIVLHDGSSIRYVKRDGTVIDELLEVLKRGVAEAKSAKVGWTELA